MLGAGPIPLAGAPRDLYTRLLACSFLKKHYRNGLLLACLHIDMLLPCLQVDLAYPYEYEQNYSFRRDDFWALNRDLAECPVNSHSLQTVMLYS